MTLMRGTSRCSTAAQHLVFQLIEPPDPAPAALNQHLLHGVAAWQQLLPRPPALLGCYVGQTFGSSGLGPFASGWLGLGPPLLWSGGMPL